MRRLAAALAVLGLLLIPAPAIAADHSAVSVEQRAKHPKPTHPQPHSTPHKKPQHAHGKKPSTKPGKKPGRKPAKRPGWKRPTAQAPRVKAPKAVHGRVCPVRSFEFGDGFGADRGRRAHLGLDMSGRRGAPLFAVESGRVNRTKRQSNKAIQIVLQGSSGSKFYYGHMDAVFITGGQRVKKGQVIGLMGDTGSPGEVHLHFEYWKSGGESDAVDPEPLIARICGRER